MKITPSTFSNFSKEEILTGAETGQLVFDGIGFFEKVILSIIQLIAGAKAKLRARVDTLEKENSLLTTQVAELQEAVQVLQHTASRTSMEFTKHEATPEPDPE